MPRTPTSRHRCPIQKRPFSRLPCAPDLGHLRVHEDRACEFGSLPCTFSIRHCWRLRPHSSSRRASFVYMATSPHFGHTGTAQKGASVCTADETSLQARCLCVHGGSDVLAGLSPSVYTIIGHSAPKGAFSVCTRIEDICGLVGVLPRRGERVTFFFLRPCLRQRRHLEHPLRQRTRMGARRPKKVRRSL